MSQTEAIFRQLREAILGLDLGPGERLSERLLEARFAGSRTPVRAALMRLEAEDLIRKDGRHWLVAPIDLDEIRALAEFRAPLEAAVVRLIVAKGPKADLGGLEALLVSLDQDTPREEWLRAGTDFHVELARLSDNPFLLRAIQDAMTRLSRARWLEVLTPQSRERARDEHREILTLLQAGRGEDAARAAEIHARATQDRLLASLKEDRRGLRARGLTVVGAP